MLRMNNNNNLNWEAPQLTLITINETENLIDFFIGVS
jgi:hypothetical protein